MLMTFILDSGATEQMVDSIVILHDTIAKPLGTPVCFGNKGCLKYQLCEPLQHRYPVINGAFLFSSSDAVGYSSFWLVAFPLDFGIFYRFAQLAS